ncbi:MAG: S-layer homology domain-containing protein, partial [Oscillospiraceae bacterium]|jgi:hypothetical protein
MAKGANTTSAFQSYLKTLYDNGLNRYSGLNSQGKLGKAFNFTDSTYYLYGGNQWMSWFQAAMAYNGGFVSVNANCGSGKDNFFNIMYSPNSVLGTSNKTATAHEHVYTDNVEVIKKATTTEAGILRTYCDEPGCIEFEDSVIPKLEDAGVPTWGTGAVLTATPSGTSVALSWPAATDDVGVTGYQVYQGETLLATVTETSYTVTGLSLGSYTFSVKAVDASENVSVALSADATIKDSTNIPVSNITESNNIAEIVVSKNDVNTAIGDAKENNSASIIIAPVISKKTTKVVVALDKDAVSSIASQTDAALKVETAVGNVTIPKVVLECIAEHASDSSITFSLEHVDSATLTPAQQAAVGSAPVYDISIASGSSHISSFGGSSITISLPYTLKEGESANGIVVWYLNDSGALEKIACTYNAEAGMATFTTNHLSYYLVNYSSPGSGSVPDAGTDTGWNPADYTGFLSEQIYGKNIIKISTYSKWLGKDDPKNIWPIATDDTSEWGATVAAYDGSKNLLGYIDVPASAGGMVDYSTYVSKGIQYIRVTQASGSDSGYISITVYDADKDTDDKTDNKTGNKFDSYTDIPNDWSQEGCRFVIKKGLFKGTSETTFSPHSTMSREMLVTVLYRMAGSPEVTGSSAFADVSTDSYSFNAVKWAYQNGVVNGTSYNTFEPNGEISREQLAAILYRYAKLAGYDVSTSADLSGYTDKDDISDYATSAMQWAVSKKLITGAGETRLSPKGEATRAQVATILMRFYETFSK